MLASLVTTLRRNAAVAVLLLTWLVLCLTAWPNRGPQILAAETEPAAAQAEADAPAFTAPEPIEFETKPQGYPSAQIEVRDLAFSPDGKLLAAGYGKWDTAGEVVVYDFASRRVLKKFPLTKGVASLAFSVDGKYLAASTWTHRIEIWDAETWELAASKVGGSRVARIAFSPDGKYLALGTEAGELKLWNVGPWDEARAFTGELFRFQKVAFSPDSKLLCAVGGRFEAPQFGRGLVFEVETGRQIAKFESEGAVIASVAFSPDGKEIATGEYGTALRFWEPRTGKPLMVIPVQSTMDTLEYTPDGTLVGPSFNGAVYFVELVNDRRILRAFNGHVGRSLTARVSPDGKTLVSGGVDGMIRIWNPETAAQVDTLRPVEAPEDTAAAVLAVAHAPDGRHVVTTHEDGTVRLRDAETGQFIRLLSGHEDVVAALAFSPDGRTLATGSYDHAVKLWDVNSGEEIRTLEGHTNWVFSLAFSPDGKTLASGGYDKTIRLWSIAGGETEAVLEGHTAAVRSLAYSPGGERLVSGSSDRSVRIWDLAARETVHELKGHAGAIRAVAFSPDGSRVASGSEDQAIRLWNANTGELLQELKGHTGMVWCLAFSPRGRTLASGGFDNTVRIWDGTSGAPLQALAGHQDVVTSLSYAPDGMSLVTGSYDKSLKLWPAVEAPTPALADLKVGDDSDTPVVRFVVFSPDGTTMITGNQNRSIRAWDLQTGQVKKTVLQPRGVSDGALSRDGKFLVTGGYGEQIYLWDASTLELLATLETGHAETTAVAFSPDGRLVAAGAWDGAITIWDASGIKIRDLPVQEMPIGGLAFSPDGHLLATTTGNFKEFQKPGKVKLWDTKTWEEVADLDGPTRKMRPVAFSPDGSVLVAGGSQPELLVYDVPNRKLVTRLPVGTEVSDAAFLPDGRTLVLGGYDGRVGLWSLDTKKRVVNYDGHRTAPEKQRYVFDVAVAADASVVVSAGADGHVKLWPTSAVPPVKPVAVWETPGGEAMSVAFSPDGRRSAVTTKSREIEIRSTADGQVLLTIGHLNTVCVDVEFSPDGRMLAGAMQGGRVYLWDAETGQEQFKVDAHSGGARRARFSPDGRWLATCGWDETAAVWNVPDGSLRYRTEKQGLALCEVAFSPEGKLLATATGSWRDWRTPGTVKLWMAEDGRPVAEIGSHEAEIKGLAFDGGGHHLISYGGNGAKLWDRINRKLIRTIGAGTTITAAAFSPDGSTLYTGDRSGRMLIYDVPTGRVKGTLEGHDALVYSVARSSDGTLIASASKDGTVKLWPTGRLPAITALQHVQADSRQLLAVAYSPDGRLLAVGGQDRTISLRNAETLDIVGLLSGHNGVVIRLTFTPDGKSLVSGSTDGTVRLWNLADGKEIAKWKAHGEKLEMVRSLAVSADGKLVAAGNWAGDTFVWSLETQQEVHQLPTQTLPVGDVTFSPDGKLLVTCTGSWKEPKAQGQLKLWDAETGKELATLDAHAGGVRGAAFTKDGKTLLSFGWDRALRLWGVATREMLDQHEFDVPIATIDLRDDGLLAVGQHGGGLCLVDLDEGDLIMQTRGHSHLVCGADFSPAGTRLATICHNGYLDIWPTEIPAPAIRQFPATESGGSASLAERARSWKP